MYRNWHLGLLLMFLASPSAAQDNADVEAFNSAWGRYQEAKQQPRKEPVIQTSRDVLEAGRKIFAPSDSRIPVLMTNYGIALIDDGQKEEAKEILQEALEVAEGIHGEDSMELVIILFRIGDAVSEPFSPKRQIHYYRRALRIVAAEKGNDSDEYANLASLMGASVLAYSNSDKGRRYLVEAKEIFDAKYGEQSWQSGIVSFQLGKLEFSRGKHQNAIEQLLPALNAFSGDDEDSIQYQMYTRAFLVQAYEESGMSDLATEHCVAIGRLSALRPDTDYQPLFRMAPKYPGTALKSGREGLVDFEFTVNEAGFVTNAEVINSTSQLFIKEARKAVERFRYAPRIVDGEAVAVDGIQTRISFQLED